MISHIKWHKRCRWFRTSCKPKLDLCCIAWSKQQEALSSTWMLIKQFLCFKQEGAISTLSGKPLKLVDQFTYLGNNVSSTESNVHICLWRQIIGHMLSLWLIKHDLFQAGAVSIILYGYNPWILTKHMEKKLDENYTRLLRAVLNKSWEQHLTKQQLYSHLPPFSQTIQVKW